MSVASYGMALHTARPIYSYIEAVQCMVVSPCLWGNLSIIFSALEANRFARVFRRSFAFYTLSTCTYTMFAVSVPFALSYTMRQGLVIANI